MTKCLVSWSVLAIGFILAIYFSEVTDNQSDMLQLTYLNQAELSNHDDKKTQAWLLDKNPINYTFNSVETDTDHHQLLMDIVTQKTQFQQYAAAYQLAIRSERSQLLAIINALLDIEVNTQAKGLLDIFYRRLVTLDAQSALEHFWQNVPQQSSQYRRVLYGIYYEWAWINMQQALNDVVNNAPVKEREELLVYLLQDEHFATDHILLSMAHSFSDRTRATALLMSAKHGNSEAAFLQILSMPKSSEVRRHSLFLLVRQWVNRSPQVAIDHIQQMKNGGEKQNLLTTAISVWAESDPEQALLAAIQLEQGKNLGYAALSGLARTDGPRAMQLAEQYKDKLSSSIGSQVMQTWASANASEVANYLEVRGGGILRTGARQIAWHYTIQNPEEAYQWVERVGLLDNKSVASNMGNALVQTDLNRAEQLFEQLPESAARSGLFTNIVRQRSKIDLADTYEWLTNYKNEPKFVDAHNNLLYQWSRKDPQKAIEVALTLENYEDRVNYLTSAVSNWYERDPDVATNWAFELSYGKEKDYIIANLAQKVSQNSYDEALQMAKEIDNEQLRIQTIDYIHQQD